MAHVPIGTDSVHHRGIGGAGLFLGAPVAGGVAQVMRHPIDHRYQQIVDTFDVNERKLLLNVFRDVPQVLFVGLGQHNASDAGSMSGQDLFLDTADGQH